MATVGFKGLIHCRLTDAIQRRCDVMTDSCKTHNHHLEREILSYTTD